MSLNGLDDAKVTAAYEAAKAEPGGWFLLKYASRDEVEILGKGNGGIVEVRNAIAAYEESMPLFGYLRYRRRNVIIKYVPEDCSRLVQVRLAVHFNAVTERFSPHDTIFPIASSKDLKDSTLSAACSLHTASGSTSSSTSSLRRRRLMEIAEDQEEEHRAKRQSTVPEERPTTAITLENSTISSPEPALLAPAATTSSEVPPTSHTDYRALIADLETTPPPPREPLDLEALRPKTPNRSTDDGRRKSSHSTRPELTSYSSYGSNNKPKIKLGPRPSLDVAGRPHTSASQFRPVSSLPTGLKLHKSPNKQKDRSRGVQAHEAPAMTFTPAIPETHVFAPQLRPHTSGARPTTSSGVSMRPMPSPSSIAPSMKFPSMTPEKARLMKALELRKKKEQAATSNGDISISQSDKELPTESQQIEERTPEQISEPVESNTDSGNHATESLDIQIDRSPLKTDESDATRSDSYSVSPIEPSEKADSTRASSISGSTDETIQERKIESSTESSTNQVQATVSRSGAEEKDDDIVIDAKQADDDMLLLKPTVYSPTKVPSTIESKEDTVNGNSIEHSVVHEQEFEQKPQQSSDMAQSEVKTQSQLEPMGAETKSEGVDKANNTNEQTEEDLAKESATSKEWKIPTSKFSRAEKEAEDAPTPETLAHQSKDNDSSQEKKRRGPIEPIRTDIDLTDRSAADSDANLSSDEEFLDELRSAVVQEALPMSVSKSPMSPVFPSSKKTNRFSRTFSIPLGRDKDDHKLDVPRQSEKRTVSAGAAFLNKINQQQDKPVVKKVNVGSGISQRIKALEKLSSTGSPPPGSVTTPGATSTSFFSVRKASIRDASSSSVASVVERANSFSRNTPSPTASRDGSPDISRIRDRSGSVKSRLDMFKSSPSSSSKVQRPPAESVSVTAKIVRDPGQSLPIREPLKDTAEFKPLELKKSPLVITQQTAPAETQELYETVPDRRISKESSRSTSNQTHMRERRSSITVIKDFISEGRSSFSEKRRSINLESVLPKSSSSKSPSRPPSTHQSRPLSISSRLSIGSREQNMPMPIVGSFSSDQEEKVEKKASRATRLMNRMSSSFSSSRKNTHPMSPTVREEFEPPMSGKSLQSNSTMPPTPTLSSFGEVNVQFPDSLLWKRRSMALDSQGFLILTAVGSGKDKQSVAASRKFHFSAFRFPVIPDVEMQELPNSVVLDFVEGGGLQIACEDRAGQMRALKVLQDAHKSWGAYGQ